MIQDNKETGSVLFFAIMVLLLLTIAGLSALDTSETEISTTMNSLIYKQNLYEAEATATEAISRIKNVAETPGTLPHNNFNWVQLSTSSHKDQTSLQNELSNLRNTSLWNSLATSNPNNAAGTLSDTTYRAMDFGASMGESLSLNNSMGGVKHEYAVIGRYNQNTGARRGQTMVEKGFRVRVE